MYTIQANPSGTRSIEVSSENLKTIEKYALFRHLIDSTGIVDEPVLDKLKLNIRSLIASQEEDSKELLDPVSYTHLAYVGSDMSGTQGNRKSCLSGYSDNRISELSL